MSTYLLDEYVNVSSGEPFRLFPFGTLIKNGKKRDITPEIAAQFRLPHFRPPIKLGSHADETPAGGHIVGLEVRDDGLYAIPEFTDKGGKAITEGDYRYHSPEVIWSGGYLEDPDSGDPIEGPLIVGAALLHTPHLGEKAALYSIAPHTKSDKGVKQMEEYTVPKGIWDRFNTWLDSQLKREDPDPVLPTEPTEPDTDKLTAVQKERDNYAAKYEALVAENEQREQMTALIAEFDTDQFGAAYQELHKAEGLTETLMKLDEKDREVIMQQFRALSAQINESNLIKDIGVEGQEGPVDVNAVIEQYATEKGITYVEAFNHFRVNNPELLQGA